MRERNKVQDRKTEETDKVKTETEVENRRM